jgi:hypothetical protein
VACDPVMPTVTLVLTWDQRYLVPCGPSADLAAHATTSLGALCVPPSTGIDAARGVQQLTAADCCKPLLGHIGGTAYENQPGSGSAAASGSGMSENPSWYQLPRW